MARHYLGKELNRSGAGLKTIMGALDHSRAASSLRYRDADIEILREANIRATKALGNLLGKVVKWRRIPGFSRPLVRERS